MIPQWCKQVCGAEDKDCKILSKEQPFIDKKLDIATKQGAILPRNPRNAFGTVWVDASGIYRLYYCNFQNVYIATNCDGIHWRQFEKPIMKGDPNGWDNGIDCATVFRDSPMWYMLYRGHNFTGSPSYAIGLATSFNGFAWFKCPDNPVMAPDKDGWDGKYEGTGLSAPFDPWGIIKVDITYYLWFNSENPDTCRTTGLATSRDLVHWTRDTKNPIFKNGKFCVSPFRWNDDFYLIVTAGGFRRDGSNRFELYKDKHPTFYPESREFLGTILGCGEKGDFDELYIDAPNVLTRGITCFPIRGDNDRISLYYTGEADPVGSWCHGLAYLDMRKI